MSTSYTTEPPPTASVVLHTTAGPIPISLFATQTPLTCRNFLQLCLDGYYNGCLWHRVVPGFLAQSGDPTGTGGGGENIYEVGNGGDGRLDAAWAKVLGREVGEKVVLGDELHGRLRFNRRGLLGMAKGEDGGYGSQFFVTLGDCRAELDGRATMFGRVEGEGVYNVVKIAEGEVVGERPVFPERILRVEVMEMPTGVAWQGVSRRERIEVGRVLEVRGKEKKGDGKGKKKARKGLLSFGGEEGEEGEDVAVKPRKAKFNTALIATDGADVEEIPAPKAKAQTKTNGHNHSEGQADEPPPAKKRKSSVSPSRRETLLASMTAQSQSPPLYSTSPPPPRHRKPSFHEPTTRLPLRNGDTPSRSLSPAHPPTSKSQSSLSDEIAALKASMRRDTGPAPSTKKKLSALEAMIPASSTRGRKRPRPGEGGGQREDAAALELLNRFKKRLDEVREDDGRGVKDDAEKGSRTIAEGSRRLHGSTIKPSSEDPIPQPPLTTTEEDTEEIETPLCDLHFIAHCQSCSKWASEDLLDPSDPSDPSKPNHPDTVDSSWLSHRLAFGRDTLGKDLSFKKRQAALEELVVIDPREKEGVLLAKERERVRARKEGLRGGGKGK